MALDKESKMRLMQRRKAANLGVGVATSAGKITSRLPSQKPVRGKPIACPSGEEEFVTKEGRDFAQAREMTQELQLAENLKKALYWSKLNVLIGMLALCVGFFFTEWKSVWVAGWTGEEIFGLAGLGVSFIAFVKGVGVLIKGKRMRATRFSKIYLMFKRVFVFQGILPVFAIVGIAAYLFVAPNPLVLLQDVKFFDVVFYSVYVAWVLLGLTYFLAYKKILRFQEERGLR